MTTDASNPTDEEIRELLQGMRRVAVVGLSDKEDRASYGVSRFMVGRGLEVTGVNPVLESSSLGVPVVPDLGALDGPVDVVNVFRRSEAVPPIAEAAVAAGARALWLQEGVVHEDAAAKARAAGLLVVQDRCLYKEWLRLVNG